MQGQLIASAGSCGWSALQRSPYDANASKLQALNVTGHGILKMTLIGSGFRCISLTLSSKLDCMLPDAKVEEDDQACFSFFAWLLAGQLQVWTVLCFCRNRMN